MVGAWQSRAALGRHRLGTRACMTCEHNTRLYAQTHLALHDCHTGVGGAQIDANNLIASGALGRRAAQIVFVSKLAHEAAEHRAWV